MSEGRATAACKKCRESVDVPATPFGKGLVAAFERFHAGHDDKKEKR